MVLTSLPRLGCLKNQGILSLSKNANPKMGGTNFQSFSIINITMEEYKNIENLQLQTCRILQGYIKGIEKDLKPKANS